MAATHQGPAGATRLDGELRAAVNVAATTIGRRGGRTSRPAPADTPAARMIEAARSCPAWTELDPDDLVQRERGYLVSAETDEAFQPYMGDAFSPGGVLVADMTPLAFVVADSDVLVLERQPQKWSELLYHHERARASRR
jgi:hypothetical protein